MRIFLMRVFFVYVFFLKYALKFLFRTQNTSKSFASEHLILVRFDLSRWILMQNPG